MSTTTATTAAVAAAVAPVTTEKKKRDVDAAFDEFCQKYLQSRNGFLPEEASGVATTTVSSVANKLAPNDDEMAARLSALSYFYSLNMKNENGGNENGQGSKLAITTGETTNPVYVGTTTSTTRPSTPVAATSSTQTLGPFPANQTVVLKQGINSKQVTPAASKTTLKTLSYDLELDINRAHRLSESGASSSAAVTTATTTTATTAGTTPNSFVVVSEPDVRIDTTAQTTTFKGGAAVTAIRPKSVTKTRVISTATAATKSGNKAMTLTRIAPRPQPPRPKSVMAKTNVEQFATTNGDNVRMANNNNNNNNNKKAHSPTKSLDKKKSTSTIVGLVPTALALAGATPKSSSAGSRGSNAGCMVGGSVRLVKSEERIVPMLDSRAHKENEPPPPAAKPKAAKSTSASIAECNLKATTATTIAAPKNAFSFKVITCGMRKAKQLPIPKDNFYLELGDFGDDAGFYAINALADAIGVADGASGNAAYGYDPGDFSRHLMRACAELFAVDSSLPPESHFATDPRRLLLKAYDAVQDSTSYGSCTACVLTLDHATGVMSTANVGDTGYIVVRDKRIVHQSEPQLVTSECPKQLDSYPWKAESRLAGVSYTNIVGRETDCQRIQLAKDDIVIVSSDGLFDNLDEWEMETICEESKTLVDIAYNIVYRSVKYYVKPDDILVLVARVVESSATQQEQQHIKSTLLPPLPALPFRRHTRDPPPKKKPPTTTATSTTTTTSST